MTASDFRRRLGAGAVHGTFLMEFGTPGAGPIVAAAGAEFVFVDMQHTGWSLERVGSVIAGCQGLPIEAGVRLPAAVPWMVGAVLDLGATLIMIPAVDDAATAESVVRAARYPPHGTRAVTFNVAHDRWSPPADVAAALSAANDEVSIFVQIETRAGLDHVAEIAAVDGVDVLWVGDNDLAAALGVPGEFTHPRYLAALDRVAEAAQAAGKCAGFTTGSPAVAADMFDRGYRALAFGNDIKVFGAAMAAGLDAFDAAARERGLSR